MGIHHVFHHCELDLLRYLSAFRVHPEFHSSLPSDLKINSADTSNQVMESFDMFLNGNFVALPHFKKVYGVEVPGHGKTIETKWQSSLFQAGQCGAFVGVFLAGPVTNKFGYRWTTIFALMLMNATIFVSFFVSNPPTIVELVL